MVKKIIHALIGFNHKLDVGKNNESTRVKWLQQTLARIPAGSRILDAGAGEQQFKKFCSHLTYVSQDFAEYKPADVKSGLQMASWDYGKLDIVSDIASIPEPDHSFDAIMCTEVFEHIIHPLEAIKEFKRLTKKGGYLVITAPFCSLTHFAPYHFYTGFNRYFYESALKDAGFEIIEIQTNGNYFEYLAQELLRLQALSSKYAPGEKFSVSDKRAMRQLQKTLDRLSKNDKGSSEALCFGYHVFARKL